MKRTLIIAGGLLLMLVVCWISAGVGAVSIPMAGIVQVLLGGGEEQHQFILMEYRLPRIVLSVLIGSGLAVAGVLLQGIIRNPLASPDVIGLTKGAGLAAVLFIVLLPKSPPGVLPFVAFLGAGLAGAILFILSAGIRMGPSGLALSGIGISALFTAGIQYVTVKHAVDANTALLWLAGSLWGRGWEHVLLLFPWIVIVTLIALYYAKQLDLLSLGQQTAGSLGVAVGRVQTVVLLLAVLVTGACVAVSGSIGFVGLIAPHMARRLVGPKHFGLLLMAGYVGAMLVLISDLLGRWIIVPKEIPVGIVCAVLGAPYFLWLLRKESKG
jgi:ferric citrate transport system permease protein